MRKKINGFTLIELLIVIAILGVLAASLLALIDPFEQLAKSRDAGRKSTVAQLATGAQSRYIVSGSYSPIAGNQWITQMLVNSGEFKTLPQQVNPIGACTTSGYGGSVYGENGFCYHAVDWTDRTQDGKEAIIHVELESKAEKSKCTIAGTRPLYLWSSADGRMGVVCEPNGEPRKLTGIHISSTIPSVSSSMLCLPCGNYSYFYSGAFYWEFFKCLGGSVAQGRDSFKRQIALRKL